MNKNKSYYRRITEALPQRSNYADFAMVFLSVAFVFLSLLSVFAYIAMNQTKESRHEALDNLDYWKQVASTHPNSPDAFYEAGYYAARIGDVKTANSYLDEAIRLDPEFKKAKTLSQRLGLSFTQAKK